MRLSDQVKCRQWSSCDVGKRGDDSGDRKGVVFPQDIVAAPQGVHGRYGPVQPVASYENWQWEVYVSYPPGFAAWSGKKFWSVCPDHSKLLLKSWETIFKAEVDEYNAYHAYMERIER